MKKLLFGAVALTLAFTSCKKDDNNSNNSSTPSSYIKIGSTSYTYSGSTSTFMVTGNAVAITGANGTTGSVLTLTFPGTTAPAAGTYRVVAFDSTKATGQVGFAATTSDGTTATAYHSTGAGSVDVTVSITSGKYKIVLPDAPAAGTAGTTGSTTVSANVTQQ